MADPKKENESPKGGQSTQENKKQKYLIQKRKTIVDNFEIMFTWQPFQRNIKVPAKRMLFQLKRKSTVFFLAG